MSAVALLLYQLTGIATGGRLLVPCLRCGGPSEEESLVCDKCADTCLQDPKFFLSPVLIGPSVFSRLRSEGSAAYLLGPNTRSDVVNIPSSDLPKAVKDINIQAMPHEELQGFYVRCDSVLAHLGVPLRSDGTQLMLTEDAADAITTIVQKVNATEKMYPLEAMSDLYVRVGVVYWAASKGILFRTTSARWRKEKGGYLVQRAKAYFSKVIPSDDLYSISIRNLGLLCMDAEEWTEAEERLSDALTHFPDDYRIGEALAKAHVMLGNQMEALSRLDETLMQVERPELYVLKGRILRDIGRPEDAVECFSQAILLDPKYLPAHDIKIETLRGMRRTEDASKAESERALSTRPDLEKKISELIFEFKKAAPEPAVPEAAAQGRPAERAPPKPEPEPVSGPTPIDPARVALTSGDFDDAIQKASEVLSAQPDLDEAQLILIEALVGKGSIGEAAVKTRDYYEKHREDPIAWYWRGVVSDKENKWGAAVQYFSKAVTIDPELSDAWVLMGEVLLAHGRQNGADESFSRALALDDSDSRAWLGKAKTMKELGRWGAAVQCLDKYTSLEPSDKAAWLLKADLLLDKGRFDKAVESYDKYLELSQADSYVLGRKGIALNSIGRTDEARKCLEESVRLDPNNKDAAKWLKVVQGGGA